MNHQRPFLDNPSPGWKHDLPGPGEPPRVKPESGYLANTPNKTDDVYLELSTTTLRGRGVITWVGLFCVLVSLLPLSAIFLFSRFYFPVGDLLLCLTATLGGIWGGTVMIRTDISMPRDEPIRFNRARRKVYAYHFIRDWKRPFSRSAWGVRIASYDWDDLHAEACETYGPMGTGGFSQSVMLSVRKSGTRDVIKRFVFSHNIYQGEEYWAIAQLFMQQGPQALPHFKHPPRERNSEQSHFNVFWRFAPKVAWPADIDFESRTAPGAQQ